MKITENVKPQEDVTQKLCQAGKLGGDKTVVYQEHSGRQKSQENLQITN